MKLSGSYTSIIFNLYGDYEVSVPGRTNEAYILLKASNFFCDVTVTEDLGKGSPIIGHQGPRRGIEV
jgi:hypothetical protein